MIVIIRIMLYVFCLIPSTLLAKDFTVHFFHPHNEGNFWNVVTRTMQAACGQLNCRLKVHLANGDHNKMLQQLKTALEQDKPDAIIFQPRKKNGVEMLKLAEQYETPALIIDASLTKEQLHVHGGPRSGFKFWLGELVADNVAAGKAQMETLINLARKKYPNRTLSVLAFNGAVTDESAVDRIAGLKESLNAHPEVTLAQIMNANWSRENAKSMFNSVYPAYKDLSMVWTASDAMGVGVIDAVLEPKNNITQNFLAGGIDWYEKALELIDSDKMAVSVGGHFMQGAWAIILLHDYFNGKDFAKEATSYKIQMRPITKENYAKLASYLKNADSDVWKNFNYQPFSKAKNVALQKYDFDILKLLN